jgi:hypothetical protein
MLHNGDKPVVESELLRLFELTERRQLGGVKTGLRTSLGRAGTKFDRVIEQVNDSNGSRYAFRPGAAEKIRVLLEGYGCREAEPG